MGRTATGASAATAATPPDGGLVEIEIRPRTGWIAVDWRELYEFRELLFFLAWRDVKVRYKQTALGVAWAVLQPLGTMAVLTLIFGVFARVPSEGRPYPVFVLAGLIPWTLVSGGVTAAATSLVQQQNVLSKVYFPRLFVPAAAVGPFLVDLVVSLPAYGVVLACYGVVPGWRLVFLPALVVLAAAAALGAGLALAALIVLYRDLRHVLPFGLQLWMFLSPVIYSARLLPARYRGVLALNPLTGIIEGFRWSLLGAPCDAGAVAAAAAVTAGLLAFGLFYFRKTERLFADIA